MDDVFLKLVNLSISASWLILTALVLRFVLKKAPKWVMLLLWGVVALRLVCPFSIESALSLIPSAETIPSEIMTETREPVLYEQATLDIVTNPTLPSAAEVPVGVMLIARFREEGLGGRRQVASRKEERSAALDILFSRYCEAGLD